MRTVTADALGLPGGRTMGLVGELPPRPRVAVVGARAAHRQQRRAVPWIVETASALGWSIVSGGALGIDGDAHRAALSAGVEQVAVLPCGPDRPYPPDHVGLFEAMAEAGAALLFAQPRGTAPTRAMFASRNALVVGLSDAVLVVDAAMRSGTMLTGRLAMRDEKALGAVIGSRGAAALVASGARALPADDEQTLREAVRGFLSLARGEEAPAPEDVWPPHLEHVRDALRPHGRAGAPVGALGDPVRGVMALAEAEVLGLIAEVVPGRWVAIR